MSRYRLVVLGASAGGVEVLSGLVAQLPETFPLPIVVVQHLSENGGSLLAEVLARQSKLPVHEVDDKDELRAGHIYLAPAGYHVLVERDGILSLSVDPPVHFSRPSIDVLFESAAAAYGAGVVAVLFTGANRDGADGLAKIAAAGGHTVVENPDTAAFPMMPRAGLAAVATAEVLPWQNVASRLTVLARSAPS